MITTQLLKDMIEKKQSEIVTWLDIKCKQADTIEKSKRDDFFNCIEEDVVFTRKDKNDDRYYEFKIGRTVYETEDGNLNPEVTLSMITRSLQHELIDEVDFDINDANRFVDIMYERAA